jgi:magnesium transporter
MNTPQTADNLQDSLHQITELLHRHRLVEHLVHRTDSPKHDLIESLVHRQHLNELRTRLNRLHPADVAYVLEALPLDERLLVWQQVQATRGGDILPEVSDAVRPSLIEVLNREELLALVSEIDTDELPALAEDIPADILAEAAQLLEARERQWLQSSLTYPHDAVGHRMSLEMVVIHDRLTLEQVLGELRGREELPGHTDQLFVVGSRNEFRGVLPLPKLLLNDPAKRVAEVMVSDALIFSPDDDAGEAAQAFERYDLVSAPVVDGRHRLVGRLTVDSVIDYIRETADEEALNRAGLSGEEDLFAPMWDSARNRWLWLSINLVTAFLASRVIGLFEGTIESIVALATLMPIVAGIGGNTGNQTTALVIRGLALNQVNASNALHLVLKELGVSLLNGVVWGSVMGFFAFLLYQSVPLGLVMAAAMWLNLIVAGQVGILVPLALHKLGRDPALGSSVLLTFTTDSMGFFIFLGLATLFLR